MLILNKKTHTLNIYKSIIFLVDTHVSGMYIFLQ